MDGVERGPESALHHLKAQELRPTYSRRTLLYLIVLHAELHYVKCYFVVELLSMSVHYVYACEQ